MNAAATDALVVFLQAVTPAPAGETSLPVGTSHEALSAALTRRGVVHQTSGDSACEYVHVLLPGGYLIREALRVQEMLRAAAQAGAALRSGQRIGSPRYTDAADTEGQDDAGSGPDDATGPAGAAGGPPAEESGDAAPADERADGASKLGPRAMQALQIINSQPSQHWTPRLLAVQLEGPEAEASEKAHNRARTLMDYLAKRQFVVKKYADAIPRRCHFVAASTAEAA
ncbi:hypothetical protein ACFWP3_19285 [Streptomyces sp. NPDC058525]|uniref:hypothetical protein n=1 Tax=Streptomyces sp. NPDC058525 TaxID=3346538 RepID=UPI003666CD23